MAQRRRKKQSSKGVVYLIILIAIACFLYEPIAKSLHLNQSVFTTESAKQGAGNHASSENTAIGDDVLLPAPLKSTPEQIFYRKGYTVSYNKELKIPNWVAWELSPEKLIERESRTDKFLPDPDLPEDEAVTTNDYKGAGMDRGHMCPAGDNRWHWKAMQESFYMTNICPQNHNLNRGDWKELEEACRKWAVAEGKIYIVCGPILYKQKHRTIGKQHRITVPEAFFKVILCTTSTPPKAIGFIYKNASGNHPLDSYVNSVDEVERITGIDFFPALPDEVEDKVEATYNLSLWTEN
ncbi:DNA/RNA non-specific endonuclease [uncultured Bacteroides sp.]|uniref:DNA/RNA non-specific endonuclease n=1 Tax=uncultured Bacteroides sp. TaxID=162156 RepID=UPI0025FA9D56|nr:DNA/RNA non-specific endonuclease [uncultured Bacteroides sp.]